MFTTPYGSFNGNSWEEMMQIILKRKYNAMNYQRVPATPGDYGIEGFTKDGILFQCYCPDVNTDNQTLYKKQRQKITDDIRKLQIYEKDICKILGDVKLKTWVLITPHLGHNSLLAHCNTKKDLVRTWGLSFVDNDKFDVIVHEISDYAIDIGDYLNQAGKKLSLVPDSTDGNRERIVEWKATQIDLVNNALAKNEIRVNAVHKGKENGRKINELTDETAKHYLNGESVLRRWQSTQPENHQRFIELIASVEDELRERSLLNLSDPNEFVKDITIYMETKIKGAFPHLDESTIIRLKNYSISFWILRCPLYFEEN
ncbi:MAG: hypothetical protein DI535_16395 [Citrobacter freundii]|nr:MAG: hypothetical protein DI535_16395 [Citrobacter freundii]